MSVSTPKRALRRVVILALLAIVIYGGWAFAINWRFGWQVALKAAAGQGASSAFNTLIITGMIEGIFWRMGASARAAALAATLPALVSGGINALAQWLAGTPEILPTIALSLTLGSAFNVSYALGLWRAQARQQAALEAS